MSTSELTQRIVIKLGTSVLTGGAKRLSPRRMLELVQQIAQLHESGVQVVLVTSGAITAGREVLPNIDVHPSLPVKQMLAAVGQGRLIRQYHDLFALFEIVIGQVLLTRSDLDNRTGYLNARDTLLTLIGQRVIPVINENDTVATDEIRVGDNDTLSALVANLIDADLLILLTDQQGLFTADPRTNPDATLIPEVTQIDESIYALAGGSVSGLGTGGMFTKVRAADLAGRSGTTTVIAPGAHPNALIAVANGEALGTRFPAPIDYLESRKRWLLAERPHGTFIVDRGAADRLINSGASLLPVGVTGVEGSFERGATVAIVDSDNHLIARGLSNYASHEAEKLIRQQSAQIVRILGYTYGDAIVHRDNLVLVS